MAKQPLIFGTNSDLTTDQSIMMANVALNKGPIEPAAAGISWLRR